MNYELDDYELDDYESEFCASWVEKEIFNTDEL